MFACLGAYHTHQHVCTYIAIDSFKEAAGLRINIILYV